jgi:hypothetical protein
VVSAASTPDSAASPSSGTRLGQRAEDQQQQQERHDPRQDHSEREGSSQQQQQGHPGPSSSAAAATSASEQPGVATTAAPSSSSAAAGGDVDEGTPAASTSTGVGGWGRWLRPWGGGGGGAQGLGPAWLQLGAARGTRVAAQVALFLVLGTASCGALVMWARGGPMRRDRPYAFVAGGGLRSAARALPAAGMRLHLRRCPAPPPARQPACLLVAAPCTRMYTPQAGSAATSRASHRRRPPRRPPARPPTHPPAPPHPAVFDDACGVGRGTPLRMKGVQMGQASGLATDLATAEVTIEVNEGQNIIPAGSTVEINHSGLFGDTFLDVVLPPGQGHTVHHRCVRGAGSCWFGAGGGRFGGAWGAWGIL